jgi:pyruvate dehydrogenase E2 component (dihydrolipoamide acetyltransferase)
MANLHCIEMGKGAGAPVVFLHGFGGLAESWTALQTRVSAHKTTLAFDLPGHGGSLNYPDFGEPKVAARAVIDELSARNIKKAHLLGFSMGGAISCLIGLFAPEKVASLTLLAPGGFGPEINHRLLQTYAACETDAEFRQTLPHFYGYNAQIPDEIYQDAVTARQQKGATAALQKIANLLFDGKEQGVIPLGPLVKAGMPIKVLWGRQDNVLPTRQANALPGEIATHVFDNTGHMIGEEQGDAVFRAVMENCR